MAAFHYCGWEAVASKALNFYFFKCYSSTYSLCRTIPALFLIIPEKYVFYTATVYISDRNQVKKNSVIFSQPLCVYTCT